MTSHVLWAYRLDGKGGGEAIADDAISQCNNEETLSWVHMNVDHPDTADWLRGEISHLDPFIVDALLADETRPRMTQIGDGVLLILRGVNLNEDAQPEDMVSIRMWVDRDRIISVRRRGIKAAVDIREKIEQGKGPKDAGQFICMLVARLFQRMEPALTMLDDATDGIEEEVLEQANSALRSAIITVRKQAIVFRRYMAPQRDAIGQLRMCDVDWLEEIHKRQLQESYNHVTRYVEDLDAVRERAQIVKDELANILADRLNNNMYVLSVVAAIFMPLGFLTGLLGINVGGIPGSDNGDAFLVFCGILAAIVFVQVIIFRKFKWF